MATDRRHAIVPSNGLSSVETIRTIASNGSWAVLKNIENVAAYRTLLMDLLGELEPVVSPRTGAMLTPQGFIFISSPGSITPFHFDPEHNIRSEEHTSELQSLMRNSYAVFSLKKTNKHPTNHLTPT